MVRTLAASLALVFSIGVVGCRAHVVIDELPPPTAPLLERAEAYEQVRPSPYGAPGAVLTQWGAVPGQSLLLANGGLIFDPMELAPAVDSSSTTMVHARKTEELETRSRWLYGAALGAAALGIAGELAGGAVLFASKPPDGGPPTGPVADVGFTMAIGSAIAGVVGLLAFGVPSAFVAWDAQAERAQAFLAYDADLRARLALVPKKSELAAKWEGQ